MAFLDHDDYVQKTLDRFVALEKPRQPPTTALSPLDMIERLGHIHDDANPYFVRSDKAPTAKDPQGVSLNVMTVLAMFSSIPKAAKAQNDRTAEPTYPDAFACTPLDLTVSGLRLYYITHSPHVTATGAPCDPAEHRDSYRTIWQTPQGLLAKAQTILLAIIRTYFPTDMFSPLDPVFPGSDLLAKYWMLATNRLQRNRHDLTAAQESLFSMPLATADAFHHFIQRSRAIDVAKNILASRQPFAPNPDFVPSLLSHLRKSVDSVPVDIQTDFVAAVHELQQLTNQHAGLILPLSALTISLGALYSTQPSSNPQQALRASAASSATTADTDLPQYAFLGDQRQDRRDRRDVRRDRDMPPPRQPDRARDRTSDRDRPSDRDRHLDRDRFSSGSAKVHPTVATFETLLSQIQRALAQLKNAAEKAYKANPAQDSPDVHQALSARVMDTGSPRASPAPRREYAGYARPTTDRRRRSDPDSDENDDDRVGVEYHYPPEDL